jgi:hypothetical protein
VSRARPAGPVCKVDQGARPARGSRPRGRRNAKRSREFAIALRDLFANAAQLALVSVVLVIVAGILLVLLGAQPSNGIVSEIQLARWLASPFDGMLRFGNASDAIAGNWGIAAVVYLNVCVLIAGSQLFAATHRVRLLGR